MKQENGFSPANPHHRDRPLCAAVAIYADYEGQRTQARFDLRTHRVDITTGPLAGQSHKTPSGAAIAVVRHCKPTVNPNRNGWGFWTLDDGSGRLLQALR